MSLNQINLKDEAYLKEYEKQIHSLPLGELYEVLGIVKKDASDEREKIVSARIHDLEATIMETKKARSRTHKDKQTKDIKDKSNKKESPVKHFFRRVFWISLLAVFIAVRIRTTALQILDGSFDIAEWGMTFTMDLLPFFCFGIGYKIARRFALTKKKQFHLGVALFLISKAIQGYCFEVYLGFAYQLHDEKATYISAIVFVSALLYTINMFRRKIKDPFATNSMVPMVIALLAEQQIHLQHLI